MDQPFSVDSRLIAAANWTAEAFTCLEQVAEDTGLGTVGAARVLTAWLAAQSEQVVGVVLSVARDSAAETDGCDRETLAGLDLEGIARLAKWGEHDLGEVLLEAASFVAADRTALEEMRVALVRGAAELGRMPN